MNGLFDMICNNRHLKRIINATGYSICGLKATLETEAAFKQELVLAAIALPAIFLLDITNTNRAILAGSIFLVLIAELANTAIEAVINRISEEKHDLSKKAKDVGSAIVLVALLNALCMWGIILL